MNLEKKRKLQVSEYQARLIYFMFQDCYYSPHKGRTLMSLPDRMLFEIINFVGLKRKATDQVNECVYEMHRLRLVCRRMNEIIEKNAEKLPKYILTGIRIRSKVYNPEEDCVVLHKYGTGGKEIPCVCVDIKNVPFELRQDRISGTMYVDDLVINDKLISMLNSLDLSNVTKAVFSNVLSVQLEDHNIFNLLLCKLSNSTLVHIFGYFTEEELHLDMAVIGWAVERGPPELNGECDGDNLKLLSAGSKFKAHIKEERNCHRYDEWRLKKLGDPVIRHNLIGGVVRIFGNVHLRPSSFFRHSVQL